MAGGDASWVMVCQFRRPEEPSQVVRSAKLAQMCSTTGHCTGETRTRAATSLRSLAGVSVGRSLRGFANGVYALSARLGRDAALGGLA